VNRYITIHGHFYQPPRENPWLEEIELQDSAFPYHDWNEKITAQCYAPNAASRILDPDHRIIQIVNNYSKMSFNFGPTLLHWLERHRPATYQAILEADQQSRERFSGHGSALAQFYNHMIMPLANKRDKLTQVLWGLADFRKRFGRDPEGMWLPETAVDLETLDVLAREGIRFTLLAPRQARRVRRMSKGESWEDVSEQRIDPSMSYLCQLPSGRAICLFFYDGQISQEIAFGGLLQNGEAFAQRFLDGYSEERGQPQLLHAAVDGETFGHHQRHGDMALAYCLHYIESNNLARLTNYGEFLEKHPPTHLVEIWERSSWSCIHGIERWRENCGCSSGMHHGWTQAWRRPLREALDWLRDEAISIFEKLAPDHLRSPWEARNAYIEVVVDRARENADRFLGKHASGDLTREERTATLQLLEMQRNAMLMFTSCGWFFDEVSGIETVQILQYAAKVLQYAERRSGKSIETHFLERLERIPSNLHRSAADVYELFVRPARLDLLRVGVHYAVSSLFHEYSNDTEIYCYTIDRIKHDPRKAGKHTMVIGQAKAISNITMEKEMFTYAVIHMGDHNINGGVRSFQGDDAFNFMRSDMLASFEKADIPDIIRLMDKHFGSNNFSLWHLFRDEQRNIINEILTFTYNEVESSYRRIYENCHAIMNFITGLHVPVPKFILVAAEVIINLDLKRLFESEDPDIQKLESLIHVASFLQLEIDREMLGFRATAWINGAMETLQENPRAELAVKTGNVLRLLRALEVPLDLWLAQNIFFSMGESLQRGMLNATTADDQAGAAWMGAMHELARQLNVTLP
jgi:alpha-amylase/alpha-mannosidase (GH57 family)